MVKKGAGNRRYVHAEAFGSGRSEDLKNKMMQLQIHCISDIITLNGREGHWYEEVEHTTYTSCLDSEFALQPQ
jgi:hypothetical protein